MCFECPENVEFQFLALLKSNFVTRKITKWIGEFAAWMSYHNVSPKVLVDIDEHEVYIPGRTHVDQDFQFPNPLF